MSRKPDSQAAQRAKSTLASKFEGQPWFRGVAIVPGASGDLAVRVSVATAEKSSAREVPSHVGGVPIEVLFIDGYQPRSGAGRGVKK